MLKRIKSILIVVSVILISFLPSVWLFIQRKYVIFSDAAKFADIARNLYQGLSYGGAFTFWSTNLFTTTKDMLFSSFSTPPLMPFSMSFLFKVFGSTDFAVFVTSMFYTILTLVFVYLLSRKIFKSNLVGALSTLTVGFNYDMVNYATSGASESPFIFEIVTAAYLISLRKKWADLLSLGFLFLLYFTRPQAFIYIAGLLIYYLVDRFGIKKASIIFVLVALLGLWVDKKVLWDYTGVSHFYSITERGSGVVANFSPGTAVSDSMRGESPVDSVVESSESSAVSEVLISPVKQSLDVKIIQNFKGLISQYVPALKKVFYNLYNFYKLLPNIISPYLFALFVVGLFFKSKSKIESSFKIASVFMVIVTLIITAASIPFYRYIHPIIPLVYIIAVGTIVGVLESQIANKKLVVMISTFLILIFGVGQTLGVLVLDSRFEARIHNVGKAPVYVELSKILKDNTDVNQVVVTNLDTWGSWYGERKTVWFPLEPKQLIDPATGEIPFDAIYLTSYLMDDENYHMGDSWRTIFENPSDPKKWTCDGCTEIAKEYVLKGIYKVSSNDDYEKQDANAILLVKND